MNYATTGLGTGTYSGAITVSGAGVTQTVAVTLTVASATPLPPVEVIVDNTNAANVTVVGAWTTSTWAPGYWAGNYFHDGNAGKGTKSVTFRPNLPVSGTYEVSMWWPTQQTAYAWASNAPVDIASGTGMVTVAVNQKLPGHRWFVLGTNDFAAGTNGWVRIRTDNTTGTYVIADAVRFAQVGAIAPPPPAAVLAVAPLGLTNSCLAGTNAASQTIQVWNAGGGTLSYAATDNVAWLSVAPVSGTSTGEHDTVSVNYATAGLGTGTYSGAIMVSGAGTTQTVAVTLTVTNTPPVPSVIAVTPASLDFGTVYVGGSNDLVFQVQNTGGGTLSGSASVDLPFSVVSGSPYSLTASQMVNVVVRYTPTAAGTNTDVVMFTGGGDAIRAVLGRAANLEVIVDNTNATAVAVVGSWTTSTYAPGYWGANYLHDGNAGKGTKSVTFRPNLPVGGQYAVYLWWPGQPSGYAWASNAPVDLVGSSASNTVFVNQKTNGSQWVLVGSSTFAAGTGGTVRVRTTGTDGYVIADAVKFVKVAGESISAFVVECGTSVPLCSASLGSREDGRQGGRPESGAESPHSKPSVWTSGNLSDAHPAANLIDGNTNTIWIGATDGAPWRVLLDLGRVTEVSDLDVLYLDAPWTNMGLIGSTDAETWFDYKAQTNASVSLRYLYLNLWGGTTPPAIREIIWRGK